MFVKTSLNRHANKKFDKNFPFSRMGESFRFLRNLQAKTPPILASHSGVASSWNRQIVWARVLSSIASAVRWKQMLDILCLSWVVEMSCSFVSIFLPSLFIEPNILMPFTQVCFICVAAVIPNTSFRKEHEKVGERQSKLSSRYSRRRIQNLSFLFCRFAPFVSLVFSYFFLAEAQGIRFLMCEVKQWYIFPHFFQAV